jgi:hypothetical protein
MRPDRRTGSHHPAFEPSRALVHIAAAAWILAFGGFVVFFGRLLIGQPPVWNART